MEAIKYPEGVYYGAMVNGKREGKGTIIYNDGSRYTGSWVVDKKQGTGYLFDSDGNELHHAVWFEDKIIYEIGDSWNQKPQPQQHYDRVALFIGNCAYEGNGATPLSNCISDAEVFSARLKSFGFDTTVVRNATREDFDRSIESFTRKARNSEVALVFYSGHGISFLGRTYMVPVDADQYYNVIDGLYCLDDVVNELDRVNCNIKIAVIDACRSNIEVGGGSKGLYDTQAKNVLVAYATSPNYCASDGVYGTHSPYVKALMSVLEKPQIPLLHFFQEVSALVADYTNGLQQPYIESSLTNVNFFFNPGKL